MITFWGSGRGKRWRLVEEMKEIWCALTINVPPPDPTRNCATVCIINFRSVFVPTTKHTMSPTEESINQTILHRNTPKRALIHEQDPHRLTKHSVPREQIDVSWLWPKGREIAVKLMLQLQGIFPSAKVPTLWWQHWKGSSRRRSLKVKI